MTHPSPRLLPAVTLTLACHLLSPTSLLAEELELPIPIAQLERSEPVDFHREIMPLLQRNCTACHHQRLAEGGLNLETIDKLLSGGDSGPAVVPGDVAASLLISRASGEEEPLMPPEDNAAGAKPLTSEELGLISLWIQQGAKAGEAVASGTRQWQPIAPSLRPIYAVAFSADGRFVASGRGNQVVLYDAASHQEVARLVDPNLPEAAGEDAADIDLVQSLAFSPDGNLIATGGYRSVKLWTKQYPTLPLAETPWAAAAGLTAIDTAGQRIAVASAIHDIEIWDREQNQRLTTLVGHARPIAALATSGGRVLSGDVSGRLLLWNAAGGEPIAEATTAKPLVQLTAAADASRIAGIDIEGHVQVFQVTSGDSPAIEPQTLEPLASIENAAALRWIGGEAPRLAIATEAAELLIVEAATGKTVHKLASEVVLEVLAADPAGTQLASGGRDGQIRIWNLAEGKLDRTLAGDPRHQRRVEQLQRNAQRQTQRLERLKAQREELQKRLTAEEEAITKATEPRDAAAKVVAEKAKALQTATEAVKATEAEIEAAKKQAADLEAKLAAATAAAEALAAEPAEPAQPAKPADTSQAADAAAADAEEPAAEPPAEAVADADAAEKAAADAAEKAAAEAAAKAAAAKKQEAEKKVAELKGQLEAATAAATKLNASLEEKQKAVTKAKEEKDKSDAELAKLQPALDALNEARERLLKVIAEHDARAAAETDQLAALSASSQRFQRSAAAHAAAITALAFSPQGDALATAQSDGSLRVYSGQATTAQLVLDPPGGGAAAGADHLQFIDEQTLLATDALAAASAWQLQPVWQLQRTIGSIDDSPISDRVTAIDFHPEGRLIAVGSGPASRSGQLQIFTVDEGQLVREFADVHSDTVLSVRFSPDGRLLASSAADKVIRLVNVTQGTVLRTLEGHTHHVLAIAWHNDAVTLASAGADQSIKVWNTETGEQKRTIGGISKEATAIGFVNDSSQLLTAGADGNVRLHNADDGKAIRSFNASGDFLFSLAVSPDGTQVLSGGQSGVLRSWVVADGKLAAEMK